MASQIPAGGTSTPGSATVHCDRCHAWASAWSADQRGSRICLVLLRLMVESQGGELSVLQPPPGLQVADELLKPVTACNAGTMTERGERPPDSGVR